MNLIISILKISVHAHFERFDAAPPKSYIDIANSPFYLSAETVHAQGVDDRR